MRTAHVGAVVCASIAFAFAAQPAQATDDKTRQEIQAVKDYVSRMLAAQPAPSVVRPPSPSKEYPVSGAGLAKTEGMADRKSVLMNGNKITVRIFNYGGIGPGYGLVRGLDNLIWRNIDYIFQF